MAKPRPQGPVFDGDITWSSTGTVGFAQKPQFLHFRREETDVSEFEDKIPQAVVPRNPIPGLAAAYDPRKYPWFACKKDKEQSSSTQVDRGDGQQQCDRFWVAG